MAIKFQYNKTSLQQIEKNLKMRQRTLPIIKNKETALRLEVKRCKQEAEDLEQKLQQQIGGYESMYALWGEFDTSLVSLKDVLRSGTSTASICCRDWPRPLWNVSSCLPSWDFSTMHVERPHRRSTSSRKSRFLAIRRQYVRSSDLWKMRRTSPSRHKRF